MANPSTAPPCLAFNLDHWSEPVYSPTAPPSVLPAPPPKEKSPLLKPSWAHRRTIPSRVRPCLASFTWPNSSNFWPPLHLVQSTTPCASNSSSSACFTGAISLNYLCFPALSRPSCLHPTQVAPASHDSIRASSSDQPCSGLESPRAMSLPFDLDCPSRALPIHWVVPDQLPVAVSIHWDPPSRWRLSCSTRDADPSPPFHRQKPNRPEFVAAPPWASILLEQRPGKSGMFFHLYIFS